LLSDFSFRNDITSLITKYTKQKTSWFSNKYVLDIGCGNGRFSYGFALLKSKLTIMDQSKSAIKHTKNILKDFRIKVIKGDILKTKSLPKIKYDLVWSFGVVHHTGNTNLALKNIRKLIKNKGFLFLMVYGEPNSNTEFYEISQYNNLRKKTNELSTHEKFVYLKNRFKPKLVHGYFDAVSPNINELYSFQEIENMLLKLNFRNIQKVNPLNRNHHIICQLFE
jgi:2-polyprenyl-3-methyl-5-hydroxy-6-metoxy-1,4-benzoquinol methylase